ncbi:hypothetical protein ACQPXH_19575 [Nocardia sp. CA-135953]|uniref:hypothetical protein n=1 Tax=Nocardia sp. CA-135953 TaxID=3239978 RepID=UPI003D9896D0
MRLSPWSASSAPGAVHAHPVILDIGDADMQQQHHGDHADADRQRSQQLGRARARGWVHVMAVLLMHREHTGAVHAADRDAHHQRRTDGGPGVRAERPAQ